MFKTQFIANKTSEEDDHVQFSTGEDDMLYLPKTDWEDMSQPTTVTITVEVGDRMNDLDLKFDWQEAADGRERNDWVMSESNGKVVCRGQWWKNDEGDFYWNLRAGNNEIVANGEGYGSRDHLERGVATVASIWRGE